MSHMLARFAHMTTGPDPSVGTRLIFGLDLTQEEGMNVALLPPNLTNSEKRKDFFNMAMDVASLPGGYNLSDDYDMGFEWGGGFDDGVGRTRLYTSRPMNALSNIKSKDDLLGFVRSVEKVVDRYRSAQHQRWRGFMFNSNHPVDCGRRSGLHSYGASSSDGGRYVNLLLGPFEHPPVKHVAVQRVGVVRKLH